MARFPGFPPQTLKFLRQLEKHNNREWFQEHKKDYEAYVKAPMHELTLALGEDLERFAAGFQTDPKKAIYRIHRDVRFSNDKRPYKTHVAASFFPKAMEKHAGAGYYFHIAPREIFLGGGVYMPGPQELYAVRKRLSQDAASYRSLTGAAVFKRLFGEVQGERLKRPPKGFSADDPALDLLLGKQFLASAQLPPELAETSKLQGEISRRFEALHPWINWLNEAVNGVTPRGAR
jgi:uncharacterized protein (TIGR02453 family)